MIDLLIVDDQPATRAGVKMLLDLEPDIRVVGEAGGREEALAQVEALQPSVVLLDVALPGADGIDVAGEMLANHPGLAIVILTLHDSPANRARAAKAGVAGFTGKAEGSLALLKAIRSAF